MPIPINYDPSTISQTRIVSPDFESQAPLSTQVAKPLPYFDPAKYLSADTKVQAPFVRPDLGNSADPLAGLGNIDTMMADAQKLLASDKPSEQAQGMLKMQQANQMFTLIVELFKMKNQQALSAIGAINSR
jgi:hypothetical protein